MSQPVMPSAARATHPEVAVIRADMFEKGSEAHAFVYAENRTGKLTRADVLERYEEVSWIVPKMTRLLETMEPVGG
ncbi:hypothetical protein [Acidisoma sp. L85]|uniref:hypothetical protein n=1 Tax=Acidisoma sp. L85 TaxID=1641850 RepID=UPI00131EA5F2|nr:hypothetical protein [Acidisoma sp. L85]